jgi:hypothetical protein
MSWALRAIDSFLALPRVAASSLERAARYWMDGWMVVHQIHITGVLSSSAY